MNITNAMVYAVDPSVPNSGIWIDLENYMDDDYDAEEIAKERLGCEAVEFTQAKNFPKYLIEWGELSEDTEYYFSLNDDKKWIAIGLEKTWSAAIKYLDNLIEGEYTIYKDWDGVFDEWCEYEAVPKNVRGFIDREKLKRDCLDNHQYVEFCLDIGPASYINEDPGVTFIIHFRE